MAEQHLNTRTAVLAAQGHGRATECGVARRRCMRQLRPDELLYKRGHDSANQGTAATRQHSTLRSSWSIMMLCGLTSRCMMPFEWQKSKALRSSYK